ncbi:MAG: hypothetical protein QG655_420, partial [Actinomycetota bacterium]|nr:hypothetical protein [Actinomycetota bacterium]
EVQLMLIARELGF